MLRCVFLIFVCSWLAAAESGGGTQTRDPIADETVRYVNDQVISLGDIQLRMEERRADKKIGPIESLADLLHERKIALQELTEEEVLIQFARRTAEEHKIPLIDHERVSQLVNERARAYNRAMTLRDQAEARRNIERHQSIEFALGYFEGKGVTISPEAIWRVYQERKLQYFIPAQADLLEIIFRPSDPSERGQIQTVQQRLFKAAQDATDAAVKQVASSQLDAYLAASSQEQDQILLHVIHDLAQMDTRKDLDPKSLDLVQVARKVLNQQEALRDAPTAFKQLEEVRAGLVGKDDEAFMKIAREKSQGPAANQGGRRNKVEQNSEGPVFDAMVFALKPGELSPVFRIDDNAYLVKVINLTPARYKSFSEVSGEIETELRNHELDRIRQRAVAMLEARACIRDVVKLADLGH